MVYRLFAPEVFHHYTRSLVGEYEETQVFGVLEPQLNNVLEFSFGNGLEQQHHNEGVNEPDFAAVVDAIAQALRDGYYLL